MNARRYLLGICIAMLGSLLGSRAGEWRVDAEESARLVHSVDTVAPPREAPKARARRSRSQQALPQVIIPTDSVKPTPIANDSLPPPSTTVGDSIARANERIALEINNPRPARMTVDTLATVPTIYKKTFVPNPTKATWMAVIFPGGGQIYNRKYWKLPIVYGGFAGCAYALSWNTRMYKDYSQAYRDITDNDDNTRSYETLLPISSKNYSTDQLTTILKNRKDSFRRFRDLSIFAFIGVYALSIIDAYVDAELSNFDIGPDLSMQLAPTLLQPRGDTQRKTLGLQCVLTF